MSEDSKKRVRKTSKKKKNNKHRGLKRFLLISLILVMILAIGVSVYTIKTIASAPSVDPKEINNLLNQTSTILDSNGNLIEKIQTEEYRTIVGLDKMPKHLRDAFTSIEDERFYSHFGVDIRGIMSSMLDNVRAGKAVRGASTITQQLSRNLYLTNEKKLDRKIKEAYIAIKLERSLTKNQIMEAYLNRIYLGQGAYGVQEASQTYFSKNVEDLTIAEAATMAGIVKSPTKYSIYQTVRLEDFNPDTQTEVGRVDILGEKYVAIYNQHAIDRQKIVLKKMLELDKISKKEYDEALKESIGDNIEPGKKRLTDISSYFNDLIRSDVIEALMKNHDMSREDAEKKVYNGGLTIYSTMDVNLQRKLEDIYDNFTQVLIGNTDNIKGPAFISWKLNKYSNIIDGNGNILFYKKGNILNNDNHLIIGQGTYEIVDEGLIINNPIITPYQNKLTIKDYYTIDEKKNLVTHQVGTINLNENDYNIDNENVITIKKDFLEANPSFYQVNESGSLIISNDYFYHDETGVVQPQSSSVVVDYRNGEIKALVGGRDVKGSRILNRALVPRQPGSSIKPIAAYLPAIDNGFTAATPIDDVPYNKNGAPWPRNWYRGYRGLNTVRTSLEQSINVNSVKAVEAVGIETSMRYLEKMGIIYKDDPDEDDFVTASENPSHNDENYSALGLGGMSKGVTPLDLTGAFASIANDGKFLRPISFTKVLDSNGKVLIDNTPKPTEVVSPQLAYIMKDMLRTTVSEGIASRAGIPNMTTAGKTGTTQEQADAWFAGFTPYYAMSTWIGNDVPQLKLNQGSSIASQLWRIIMTSLHEGLENKPFDRPDGIVEVDICTQSGKRPSSLCQHDMRGSTVRRELFVKGTEPRDTCDVHVSVEVDTTTNLLANEYCPSSSIGSRVFIRRPAPYNPLDHAGIYPLDYEYTAPSSYCTIHTRHSLSNILDDLFNRNDEDEDSNEDDTGHDDDTTNDDEVEEDNNNNNTDKEENNNRKKE